MHEIQERTNILEENEAEAFVSFFVQYCLHHFFKSKREMSKELGIGYQSILLVTNTPEKYKGASLVFQKLVVYCIRKGVNMDEIAQEFYSRNDQNSVKAKYIMQTPDFNMQCPLFEEYEQALSLEEKEPLLVKAYLFMFRICMIYCKGCMHFWSETDLTECLIHQTMTFLSERFLE